MKTEALQRGNKDYKHMHGGKGYERGGGKGLGYDCGAMWVRVKDAWRRKQSLTQVANRQQRSNHFVGPHAGKLRQEQMGRLLQRIARTRCGVQSRARTQRGQWRRGRGPKQPSHVL